MKAKFKDYIMNLRIVMPDELALTWNRYVDLLKKALDHGCGETTLAEYLRRLMAMQAQLWEVSTEEGDLRGVVLTQFIDYTTHKTLHIVALAGEDLKDWVHLHAHIEAFAVKNNAVALEQWGRPGWAKVLPKLLPGYEPVYQVMRKKLSTGVTQYV